MEPRSERKVVLVTGAGSGIGRAVALGFLSEGHTAVLAGRRREPLVETASLSGAAASRALVAPADVADAASVAALFTRVETEYGRLDVLFNNAGINVPIVPMDELDVADWHAIVGVNLTGTFLCMREAFRVMKRQRPRGGRIINNGSISAQVPRPLSAPYTATKHAITGLTKSGSLDGRAYDIACGQIDIGNAATEMTTQYAAGVMQASGEVAVEPRVDAAHIVRAVLYMASLPLDVNVQFMTVMATKMPFIGRG